MITGAQTWRSALASIFQQVADAFLQQIVIQPFQQWMAMQVRMLAMKLGFIQQEQTADVAASAAKVAQKTTETTAVVSMDAAKAGAGAAASQASIPSSAGLAIAAMVAMVAARCWAGSRSSRAVVWCPAPAALGFDSGAAVGRRIRGARRRRAASGRGLSRLTQRLVGRAALPGWRAGAQAGWCRK